MVRKRSRAFLYSFLLTIAILGGLAVVLYSGSGPVTTTHLPPDFPHYSPRWGKYVPADSISVSVVNYTTITNTNSSLPGPGVLVAFTSPRADIDRASVTLLVEVVLSSPNATLDILFLTPLSYNSLSSAFTQLRETAYPVDGFDLYRVAFSHEGQPASGWIAFLPADRAIAFSLGYELGGTAVTASLDTAVAKADSILDRPDMPQLFYIIGGATGHYALSVENFPGLVQTGQLTVISVDRSGDYVQVSHVVEFSDPSQASAQVDSMRSAYIVAHQFVVYDSYVKAIEFHPIGSLQEQVAHAR